MKQTSTIEVSTRGDKNEMKSFKTVVVCAWTSIVPCASGSLSSSEERAVRLASATASFCCDKVGDDAAVVAVVAAVAAVAVAIVVVVVAAAVAVGYQRREMIMTTTTTTKKKKNKKKNKTKKKTKNKRKEHLGLVPW